MAKIVLIRACSELEEPLFQLDGVVLNLFVSLEISRRKSANEISQIIIRACSELDEPLVRSNKVASNRFASLVL